MILPLIEVEDTKSVFRDKNKLFKLVVIIALQGIGIAVNNKINDWLNKL